MSRRKKSSPADDLLALVAMLPWWAGVLLALMSYLLLHGVASQPVIAAPQPAQIGAFASQTLWRSLAMVGQYLLPFLCLLGAGTSAWRRHQRASLVTNATGSPASEALDGMTWREFEMLVGEGFRRQGYKVVETGGGGADGGIDLVLSKPSQNGSEKFLVQCKQWRAYKVGVDVVRELYGVMAAQGAAGGFVVTSGRFTDEAIKFANGRNVKLLDGPSLHGLLQQAQAGGVRTHPARPAAPMAQSLQSQARALACPLCRRPMVKRTAKRGANAGGEFWGCTGYPGCRGMRATD